MSFLNSSTIFTIVQVLGFLLFTIIIIIIIIIISIRASFSLQRLFVFLLLSLSDRKSPQVFRIFLSIRADLINAIVLIPPLISNSVSFFSKPKCINYYLHYSHRHVPQFFMSLMRSNYLLISSGFLSIFPVVHWNSKIFQMLSSSGRYCMIYSYIKTPENFVHFLFLYLLVHIPFGWMVQF